MYLERILSIIEAISAEGRTATLTVAEIAEATGVPKPSLYRQVNDLVDAGLLEPSGDGRYSIGLRTRRLSGLVDTANDVKLLAAPLLKRAAQETGVAFFLARLSGPSVDIFHAEVPDSGVSYLHPGIGARPMHACSCGKAIAAFSNDEALARTLSGRLRAYTDHTRTDVEDIRVEFEKIRELGYAECVEELEQGICSVAAPVRHDDQPVQYSLGATGTLRVFQPDFRKTLGTFVVDLCQEMADLLNTHQTTGTRFAG